MEVLKCSTSEQRDAEPRARVFVRWRRLTKWRHGVHAPTVFMCLTETNPTFNANTPRFYGIKNRRMCVCVWLSQTKITWNILYMWIIDIVWPLRCLVVWVFTSCLCKSSYIHNKYVIDTFYMFYWSRERGSSHECLEHNESTCHFSTFFSIIFHLFSSYCL